MVLIFATQYDIKYDHSGFFYANAKKEITTFPTF